MENVLSILLYGVIIFFTFYLFKKFNIKLPLLILLFIIFLAITTFIGEYFFDIDSDNNAKVFSIISLFLVSIVNIIIMTLQYKNNKELRLSVVYKLLFLFAIFDNHNSKKKINKIFSWILLPLKLLFTNEITTIKNRKSVYILNLIWIVVFLISTIILFALNKFTIGIMLYLILPIALLIFKGFDK